MYTVSYFAYTYVTHWSLACAGVSQGSVLQLSCRQPQAGVKRAKIHSVVDQRRGVHGMHVLTCTLRKNSRIVVCIA